MSKVFDPSCRRCPRLAAFLDAVRAEHPDYYCKPVAPFGDPKARVLIVGLAPGMHGANRTGRPFTGDYAGILLYATLAKFGFSNSPVKCLPPDNKPLPVEIKTCNDFLHAELKASHDVQVIFALGLIAHEAVMRSYGRPTKSLRFAHGAEHDLGDGRVLLDSYHCSRYNTSTRRLTSAMFETVVGRARALVDSANAVA